MLPWALAVDRLAGQNRSMSDETRDTREVRLHERATEEIRVLLARRKMSAAELARRAGQKPAALSRRMTGEIPFDLDELQVIARELGVTVMELLAGAESVSDTTRREAPTLTGQVPLIPIQRSNPPNGRRDPVALSPNLRRPDRTELVTAA